MLFWESGTPLEPAQRWVLYEATPLGLVPPWKRELFLETPVCRCPTDPQVHGTCVRCGGVQSPGRARILSYLVQTECLALPFWVIQGDQGGHRSQYSDLEKSWQRLGHQPDEPPPTGSLSYAPFDRRVVRRLLHFRVAREAFDHYADATGAEQEAAEQALRSAVAAYVDTAVEAAFDDLPLTRRSRLVDELPRYTSSDRLRMDYAAARDTFIQGS